MDASWLDLAVVFAVAFVAFCISTVAGGGASLLLIPVLGRYLPVVGVPAAITLGSAFSSVSRLWAFRKGIQWNIVAWFVPAALPASVLGVYLLRYVNPVYIELAIGLFLVANVQMLLRKPKADVLAPSSKKSLLFIGAAAGFVSGLSGAVGLLFNRFYLRHGLSSQQVVATRAANEILLHLLKLGLYLYLDIFSKQAAQFGLVVAAAAFLAAFLSTYILRYLPQTVFRKIGYGAMVVSGISMLASGTNALATSHHVKGTFAVLSDEVSTKIAWPKGQVALEITWDEGLEVEQSIPLTEVPAVLKPQLMAKIKPGQPYLIEEVFAVNHHGYELYVLDGNTLLKTDWDTAK
jgi:uncharacterized membrane protein YfcA